jgi:iron complex transport system substrate-binding protein
LAIAGGVNIAGREKTLYPHYSVEEVVARQPEVIILSSMNYGKEDVAKVWNLWKKWRNIPAVRDNRMHIIDTDLIDRSSPRIVDGLEEMVKIIHPEAFEKSR